MHTIDSDRLHDDLAAQIEGDLLLDNLSRSLYATDASPFEVLPAGIVRPRHEHDLQVLGKYASENAIPLTARGAGTGSVGAALGSGLIVDFARHMNAIREVGPDWIRVESGATWTDIEEALAPIGRRLPVEPADAPTATIGGLIATATGGPRLSLFHYPHRHVISARCLIDSGDIVELGRVPRTPPLDFPDRFRRLHRAATELLDRYSTTITAEGPRLAATRCGYRLDALTPDHLDYPQLLTGSEGTLALFTELTVRTAPRPRGRAVVFVGYESIEAALSATQDMSLHAPTACVLLDHRLLSLVRARTEALGRMVPSDAGAALAVEFEADSQSEARDRVLATADNVQPPIGWARWAVAGVTTEDADRLWSLIESAMSNLSDLRGGPPAVRGVDDAGVPPNRLSEFLPCVQDILRRHETTAAFLVHPLDGHVNVRPFLDLTKADDAARLWAIAEDMNNAALRLGGTISMRYGTGMARTSWMEKEFPRLLPAFRELKTIFDPRHLFNPGNIVGPNPARPAWPMRGVAESAQTRKKAAPSGVNGGTALRRSPLGPEELLLWQPDEFSAQLSACNGCGACRADGPPQRMCPIFRAGRSEEATPRAKANLLRELLRQDDSDAQSPNADAVRAVADLCVNCKMCAHECPSHVNIPKLMLEAKAAHVADHGLDRADWVMARLNMFSALGSSFSLLANRLMRGPLTRWFMEKFFGVSRRRRLPPFAPRSFLRQARRMGWTRTNQDSVNAEDPRVDAPRVALFVDVFANYHDPTIAEAALRVLKHNGASVVVPSEQTSCGMEALAQGDVETARDHAQRNLRVFANLVREGWTVVCTEPTAALALTHDYLDLLDDPDARLVAANTVEITAFLADRHSLGQLRTTFRPLELSIGHHVPCHLKALGRSPAAPMLLRLIPGLSIVEVDVGCSGMAGTFGLRAEHYETSLAAGQAMLGELRRPRIQFGATECSSCRLQMEEGTEKRTLHPVQYLALAYGLMPELESRLLAPVGGLVVE